MEVLEAAEVSVAVDCSALIIGVGSVLETAGAREVGEKAFAIGTCAQNKVQIATAKTAAVVERCDWCSPLMVVS